MNVMDTTCIHGLNSGGRAHREHDGKMILLSCRNAQWNVAG